MPLPTSQALSEASPESLQELFSRDPEGYQQQDIAKIIAEIRSDRARREEAAAQGKRVTNAKVKKIEGPQAFVDPKDMGL